MSVWPPILAGLAVPFTALVTTLFNRRHTIEIEGDVSHRDAMTAVNEANIALTTLVMTAMEPLQKQLDTHAAEIVSMRLRHEMELRGFRHWVALLIEQVLSLDGDPVDPPEGLNTDGITS